MTTNRWIRLGTAVMLAACLSAGTAAAEDKYRVAMVVKNLGNGFFDAAHPGGEEADHERPALVELRDHRAVAVVQDQRRARVQHGVAALERGPVHRPGHCIPPITVVRRS